jgi:hypothetical protein
VVIEPDGRYLSGLVGPQALSHCLEENDEELLGVSGSRRNHVYVMWRDSVFSMQHQSPS